VGYDAAILFSGGWGMVGLVKDVAMDQFSVEVLESDTPVLVDFWAPWCGPCKAMNPIVSEVAESYADKLAVCKVNVDDAPEIAAKYSVRGIPSLLMFHNGQLLGTLVGNVSSSEVKRFVDSNLSSETA
jgi:thioredoxin 1